MPLEVAIDPTMTERSDGRVQHPTVILGVPVDEDTYRDSGLVYVATPALLGYHSIDAATIDADTVVLTSQPGDIYLIGNLATNVFRDRPVSDVQRIETSPYSSVPDALITEHGVETAGWTRCAGWMADRVVEPDHRRPAVGGTRHGCSVRTEHREP